MFIKVPVSYSALVHKKRFKNPSREHFFEWLHIEVTELDDYEAPVAVEWFDTVPDELEQYHARLKWGAAPRDGICQTRWFNNDHWWPIPQEKTESEDRRTTYAENLTAESLERLCNNAEFGYNPLISSSQFMKEMPLDTDFKGKPLIPSDYKEVLESDREAKIAELLDKLNDLIIVDGKVWQRGEPPVAYINNYVLLNEDRHNLVGLIKILPDGHELILDPKQKYSLDQYDEARHAAMNYAHDNTDDPNEKYVPNIFILDSIKTDIEGDILIDIAKKVEEQFSYRFSSKSQGMNSLDPETGISYFKFRRALIDAIEDKSNIDKLVEAMEHFQPLCAQAYDLCGTELKNALSRWDTKPINISEFNIK